MARRRRLIAPEQLTLDVQPAKPEPAPLPTAPRRRRLAERSLERNEHGQPLSPETGGLLSAAEAERVVRGVSIRVTGYQWQKGAVACRACWQERKVPEWPEGQGFRMSVYDSKHVHVGDCIGCGAPVRGEPPMHVQCS